jgi:membrane protease YdiL (CAAX protease family)
MKPKSWTFKLFSFILILLILLAVFMLNITFAGQIPGTVLMAIRIALITSFFGAWRLFRKNENAKNLSFTLMVVNLAFLIVSFFTTDLLNINLESARGIAFAKLSDSFIISFVLIFSFVAVRYKLKDIYIAKGRLTLGLIIGLLSFIIMGFLALSDSGKQVDSVFLKRNLVWILIFVFSNSFMEELLFRGIFLKQLNVFLNPFWSIILTSIVFAVSHMQVTYTPDVLFFVGIVLLLGLIWGFLMHFTKSIIASVFFHAGADLMIIIPIYSSFGVTG